MNSGTDKQCPRCGDEMSPHPISSRRDYQTPICHECGIDEVIVDGKIVDRALKDLLPSWPWQNG
jgi:transposase-like protein